MSLDRSTRHSHYNLNYHVVMVTKYRKKIIHGLVETKLKEILVDVCESRDWIIFQQEVMPDHVHIFLSCPPKWSPSDIVKILKGVTARKLLQEHPSIRQNGHLWTSAYYAGSAGHVSSETIKAYIERQKSA